MPEIIPGLVSTIIPCFNRPVMAKEAVQSVLQQTYRPIEIIAVDDGSTDNTAEVLQEIVNAYPDTVRLIRKANSGAGPSREAGRQIARGEFIQYLDSDDLLRPHKFEKQVGLLRSRPECGAAYGWICVHKIGAAPSSTPYKASGEARETLFPYLLADRWWNTDTPLFRRSLCDAIGPWSDLRWSQDWEMDGRIAALGTKLAYVPDWMCDERHHTTGRQTDKADWIGDPIRLRARKRFLTMMMEHAEKAGVDPKTPQRVHFTRWIFTTLRHCAAAGLIPETTELILLAKRSAGNNLAALKGLSFFEALSKTCGYQMAGKISRFVEKLKKRPSDLTIQESFAKKLAT